MQLRTHRGLTPKNLKKLQSRPIEESRSDFAADLIAAREAGIDRWYEKGGAYFLEWTKEHYLNGEGEALNWDEPYHEEFYILMGNPWVERCIIEKPSQIGFTECLIALSAFLLCEVRIPIAMGFERENKLRDIVSPRIQPSFDHIKPLLALRRRRWEATKRKDIDFQSRKLTVAGVELTFFYTSTNSTKKDTRRASSAMSSFTAWVILGDEVELWSQGAIDIATERQSACEMITKPFRMGSTPGAEGGIIDSQVKSSGHIFEWNVVCPHCFTQQALHPFGCFLKPVEVEQDDGTMDKQYIDISGRPLDWFCLDLMPDQLPVAMLLKCFLKPLPWLIKVPTEREVRIGTAYIGCKICNHELLRQTIKEGWFEARGEKLKAFCDRLTKLRTPLYIPVALKMPRLASVLFEPVQRIRKLITTTDPSDQLQQGLGLSLSVGGGRISLPKILQCAGRKKPDWCGEKPDLVVMGVDQGKAHHWAVTTHWYLGLEGDIQQRWAEAFVQVSWYGNLKGFKEVEETSSRQKVNLLGMDNEPEVQLAADFASNHPLIEPGSVVKEDYWLSPLGAREIRLESRSFDAYVQAMLNGAGCSLISKSIGGEGIVYMYDMRSKTQGSLQVIDRKLKREFNASITVNPRTSQYPSECQVLLMDQMHLKGEPFKQGSRDIHGETVNVWNIHRTFGLDSVRDRIYRNLLSLPENTGYLPGDDQNFVYHLLTSDRRTTGKWEEIPGAPDHYFHALSFASLSPLIYLQYNKEEDQKWVFTSTDRR